MSLCIASDQGLPAVSSLRSPSSYCLREDVCALGKSVGNLEVCARSSNCTLFKVGKAMQCLPSNKVSRVLVSQVCLAMSTKMASKKVKLEGMQLCDLCKPFWIRDTELV